MALKVMKKYFMIIALTTVCGCIYAQNSVPLGIHYQAVARNNNGTELANTKISVKFSIISGDPLGTLVYQELHQDIITSKFGVFSIVIGHGVPTSVSPLSSLADISWKDANHYLKVEVKFENDFMDMGTMQFLAVPYALYAQKSLEPGPTGPKGDKGDPGDPASDNQTLSFDGSNLSISGSNPTTVPLTGLLQDLSVSKDGTGGYNLSISRGSTINLATIERDGDPTNEIQDLVINSDKLKITNNPNATEWDLTKYLDNTDNQQLSFNEVDNKLSLTNSVTADLSKLFQSLSFNSGTGQLIISGREATLIDLSSLKNDADSDPSNEIQDLQISGDNLSLTKSGASPISLSTYRQTLSYSEADNKLTISGSNTVQIGSLVAFRARKTASETMPTFMTDYDFVAGSEDYDDGGNYNATSGIFSAPSDGIYTFNVGYYATGTSSSRILKISLNGSLYEILNSDITGGASLTRSVTMKLVAGDKVKPIINVGTGYETGIGTFSGFKVY